jgi:putative endonuclease
MSEDSSWRRNLGERGERIAASYLKRHGYEILDTNYRCQWGEVDLIARKDDSLVFVEVRTRTNESYGTPAESLTYVKQERLITTAQTYLQALDILPKEWRIDLVSITFSPASSDPHVEHLENVVEAPPE